MDWIQGHEAELAMLFGLAIAAGGIVVKLTPTKTDDAWWQWLMKAIGRKPVVILAVLPFIACASVTPAERFARASLAYEAALDVATIYYRDHEASHEERKAVGTILQAAPPIRQVGIEMVRSCEDWQAGQMAIVAAGEPEGARRQAASRLSDGCPLDARIGAYAGSLGELAAGATAIVRDLKGGE